MGMNKTKYRLLKKMLLARSFILCEKVVSCMYRMSIDNFQRQTTKSIHSTDIPACSFQKVALDTVGPLKTMSTGGNRYILTVVDLRTPWPEAVML